MTNSCMGSPLNTNCRHISTESARLSRSAFSPMMTTTTTTRRLPHITSTGNQRITSSFSSSLPPKSVKKRKSCASLSNCPQTPTNTQSAVTRSLRSIPHSSSTRNSQNISESDRQWAHQIRWSRLHQGTGIIFRKERTLSIQITIVGRKRDCLPFNNHLQRLWRNRWRVLVECRHNFWRNRNGMRGSLRRIQASVKVSNLC